MNRTSRRLPAWKLAVVIALSTLLCSCVKFHISIDVQPDGSGTVAAALGMTSQAKAFVATQGVDEPGEQIRGYLIREAEASDVQEERWIDGDYEWTEYSIPFEDLDELNSRVAQTEAFESFQVTEDAGLVNKTFVLEGVITPDFLFSQIPEDVDLDISQVIDVRLAVTLPGEVTETNGLRGERGSNTVWWRVSGSDPIPIHAVSETRHSGNIRLLVAGGALLGAILAALAVLAVVRRRRRRKLGVVDSRPWDEATDELPSD